MKDLVRWLFASMAGVVLVSVVLGPVSVAHADTAWTARTLHEAWYLRYKEPLAEAPGGDLSCDTPLGCNLAGSATRPAPLVPYPDNTLHVASSTGEPDAQTYLSFDLSRAPRGATVSGGTMTFVAAPADSGTLNEASANMVACLVTESFVSVKSGSWGDRPHFDPNVCAPLVRVPGAHPAMWKLHLAPFGARWSADANRNGIADVPNYGITILPNPRARRTPIATWKVVFDGKRRVGGTPIKATLNFKTLTKPRNASPSLPSAPLADSQSLPDEAFVPRPSRSIRVPGPSPQPLTLAPPTAARSPLPAQAPKPQLLPGAGQSTARSAPLVVAAADTKGFFGGRQAVWFVALLGFGVAGLLGWSLTSQAQLRGGFRWVAAMGLARRMTAAPGTKD